MTKIRTVFYMVIDPVIVGFKHVFFSAHLLKNTLTYVTKKVSGLIGRTETVIGQHIYN